MKITYTGPSAEVMLAKAGKVFKRGEAQDCPEALANKLLDEQPTQWKASEIKQTTVKKDN